MYLAWLFINLHIWLDVAISNLICITFSTFLSRDIWLDMAIWNLNCLYLNWYGHIKLNMYIWHDCSFSYIWLDVAISNFICIFGTFIYQKISGLIWPYKTWIVYLAWYFMKLYMGWYGHMNLYMYIWYVPSSRNIWLDMAIWSFIFISGMVFYQVIFGLIWPYKA